MGTCSRPEVNQTSLRMKHIGDWLCRYTDANYPRNKTDFAEGIGACRRTLNRIERCRHLGKPAKAHCEEYEKPHKGTLLKIKDALKEQIPDEVIGLIDDILDYSNRVVKPTLKNGGRDPNPFIDKEWQEYRAKEEQERRKALQIVA